MAGPAPRIDGRVVCRLGRLARPTLGGRVLRAATCVTRVARRLAGGAHRDSRAACAPTAVLHGRMASFTELHICLGLLRCIRHMIQRTERVRHRPCARLPLRLGHRQPRSSRSQRAGPYRPAWDAPAAPTSTQLTPLSGVRDQPPLTPLSALSPNNGRPPARLPPTPPPPPPKRTASPRRACAATRRRQTASGGRHEAPLCRRCARRHNCPSAGPRSRIPGRRVGWIRRHPATHHRRGEQLAVERYRRR